MAETGVSGTSSSSVSLRRRWEVTPPAKPRKRNKQWFLFHCFPSQICSRSSFFPLVFCSVLQMADLAAEEGALEAGGRGCGCSRAWGRSWRRRSAVCRGRRWWDKETLLLAGWLEICSGRLLWGGAEASLCLCCQRGNVWCWRGTAGMEMRGVCLMWRPNGSAPVRGRGWAMCSREREGLVRKGAVNQWVLVYQLLWPRERENFGRRLGFQREGSSRCSVGAGEKVACLVGLAGEQGWERVGGG